MLYYKDKFADLGARFGLWVDYRIAEIRGLIKRLSHPFCKHPTTEVYHGHGSLFRSCNSCGRFIAFGYLDSQNNEIWDEN